MLKQANMVKRITASGGGTLEAQAGESLFVKGIQCIPSTNDGYVTVSIDRVTVGYFRVQGKSGNHLGTHLTGYIKGNIMEFLMAHGINIGYPIASGQIMTIERYAEAGNVMLLFDRYDEGDIKATDPNGSEATEFTFLQYAKVGTAPTADGDALIDTALTPAEFPDFPCGKPVSANKSIELLGVAACPFQDYVTDNPGFNCTHMKFVRDREVLFDPDRYGLPFNGANASASADEYRSNFSLIGPGTSVVMASNVTPPADPLLFDPALMFTAGEELNVYLTVAQLNSKAWTDNIDDQAFILRVKKT